MSCQLLIVNSKNMYPGKSPDRLSFSNNSAFIYLFLIQSFATVHEKNN